jgi:hypothetical protein
MRILPIQMQMKSCFVSVRCDTHHKYRTFSTVPVPVHTVTGNRRSMWHPAHISNCAFSTRVRNFWSNPEWWMWIFFSFKNPGHFTERKEIYYLLSVFANIYSIFPFHKHVKKIIPDPQHCIYLTTKSPLRLSGGGRGHPIIQYQYDLIKSINQT